MQKQVNLKEQSVEQLKSIAYDIVCMIEENRQNLAVVQREIADRAALSREQVGTKPPEEQQPS